MTEQQIYFAMRWAGFPPHVAVTMTAIALRESAGDPNAFNGNEATGDRSYGLLQINMRDPNVAALLTKEIPAVADDERALLDPDTNAKAGFLLWGGRNSNLNLAWYINREGPYQERYESHLPAVQAVALAVEVNLPAVQAVAPAVTG
ncbi:MAG TPA: transglycosylase SLT domain-containing protein [Bryobacteraceae bacterium]|nr:transglycosylase SLT domain-containing protein [Bryobacteraceae bacterium]